MEKQSEDPANENSADDDLTRLLRAWRSGDSGAEDELIARVYSQLRRIASSHMRGESRASTMEATGLVHEAYLRLTRQDQVDWQNRGHFFALASMAMRRVLVDRARARAAAKRLADFVELTTGDGAKVALGPEALLDLDRSLDRLARQYPRIARVVELRYFSGLEFSELAEALGVSERTVKRDWQFARAWMARDLGAQGTPQS